MKIHAFLLAVFVSFFGTQSLSAQEDLSELMSLYTEDNGSAYLQPIADVFTTNLNMGLFRSAKVEEGFHLDIGVIGSLSLIQSEQKTFTAFTESDQSGQSVIAPTILGSNEAVKVRTNEGTVYSFPGGFEVDMLPLAVPQVRIGSILGTEAVVRYIAFDLGDNFGRINLFGFGGRHSISQYIPNSSIDISLGYFQQKLEIAEIMDADTRLFFAHIGQTKNLFSYYAFGGFQQGSFDVAYEYSEIEDIRFTLDNEASILVGAGAGVQLSVLYLHAELGYSQQLTAAFDLGFNF